MRFRPTDPQKVFEAAERESRRTGLYGCSVFADTARAGETEDDVIDRLLVAADLVGMVKDRHPKYYVCASAQRLLDLGYTFWKDEDDDEIPEHYSVSLGNEPTVEDAVSFLSAFGPARKR